MSSQFQPLDHQVHDTLLTASPQRGLTAWQIADRLRRAGPVDDLDDSLGRLITEGYVECRWHGHEKWVGAEGIASAAKHEPLAHPIFYRSTSRTNRPQTLEARLMSKRGL